MVEGNRMRNGESFFSLSDRNGGRTGKLKLNLQSKITAKIALFGILSLSRTFSSSSTLLIYTHIRKPTQNRKAKCVTSSLRLVFKMVTFSHCSHGASIQFPLTDLFGNFITTLAGRKAHGFVVYSFVYSFVSLFFRCSFISYFLPFKRVDFVIPPHSKYKSDEML